MPYKDQKKQKKYQRKYQNKYRINATERKILRNAAKHLPEITKYLDQFFAIYLNLQNIIDKRLTKDGHAFIGILKTYILKHEKFFPISIKILQNMK